MCDSRGVPIAPTVVHAELLEGPVRADQERQDVEALRAVVPDQAGLRARRGPDRFRAVPVLPRFTVDQRLAVGRQAGERSAGDDLCAVALGCLRALATARTLEHCAMPWTS